MDAVRPGWCHGPGLLRPAPLTNSNRARLNGMVRRSRSVYQTRVSRIAARERKPLRAIAVAPALRLPRLSRGRLMSRSVAKLESRTQSSGGMLTRVELARRAWQVPPMQFRPSEPDGKHKCPHCKALYSVTWKKLP